MKTAYALILAATLLGASATMAAEPPSEQALPGTPELRQQSPGGPTSGTPLPSGGSREPGQPPPQAPAEEKPTGLMQRDRLLGDLGGLRTRLEDAGITLGLQEQSEVLGNATGGVRQGAIYEGATLMSLALDSQKLANYPGGSINISAYQIHGRGLSANNLGNLHVASGFEGTRATRLFELWYEQKLAGEKISVRIGQMSADQEFLTSQYGALFINASFGWPTLPAVNLPSGGPAYPLATPGVRLKLIPADTITLLAGVFNGDPAGRGPGDPQRRNASGTTFRLNGGVFAIAEVQVLVNADAGPPGVYKVGGWYNSNSAADQRFGYDGLALSDPDGIGIPRGRRNNWSVYAVADQLLILEPGTKDQGLGAFARIMGSPGDRNLVNVFINGGVTYKGPLPGRSDDTMGLGVSYARISDTASLADSDVAAFTGSRYPIRRQETVLELTYQAALAPWWSVQPTAQYVFSPAGGVPDPLNPAKRIGDAAIFGLRTTIVF